MSSPDDAHIAPAGGTQPPCRPPAARPPVCPRTDHFQHFHRRNSLGAPDIRVRRTKDAAMGGLSVTAEAHAPPRTSRLPMALSAYVGRRGELDAVRSALAGSRAVCLVGPGGCGKTRLAM